MKLEYKTGALSQDRIAQAFPVVREIAGDLTLEAWSDFARGMVAGEAELDSPRGIIVAEHEGYIRGLFSYYVLPDMRHGRALVLGNLSVLQVVARKRLADALLAVAAELARRHGCGAIHAYVRPQSAWTTAYFENRGHEVEKYVFCQPLAPSALRSGVH